ncbi:MAG: hypothetical protein JXB50_11820 [Spirochaetes bacterium]|nr:hypothetical protein [Spirochaetota bacterium]
MSAKKTATAVKSNVNLNQFLDEVKSIAYDIYQERLKKNTPGDEMQDWLKAETIIKKKHSL